MLFLRLHNKASSDDGELERTDQSKRHEPKERPHLRSHSVLMASIESHKTIESYPTNL